MGPIFAYNMLLYIDARKMWNEKEGRRLTLVGLMNGNVAFSLKLTQNKIQQKRKCFLRWEIKRKLSVSTDWSASAGCRAINNSVILGHRRIIIGRGPSNPILFVRYGSILGPRKPLVLFYRAHWVCHSRKKFCYTWTKQFCTQKKLNQPDRSLFHNVYCIFIYGK